MFLNVLNAKKNNSLVIKLCIALLLFGFELFYIFAISNFFSDKNIKYYFNYFKNVRLFFILTPLTTWFISAYTFSNMLYNRYLYFKPDVKNKNFKKFPKKYGLIWPENSDFKLIIGELHNRDGSRKEKPEWLIMDKNGLYTGLIVFGATGTGKTSACAYPFFDQLVNCKKGVEDEYIGGLILDVKGDFWKEAVKILERNGRQKDIIIIEPGSGYYFNPIHYPHLDTKIIAERLYSVLENMNSNDGRQDSYWKDKSINLLSNAIGLIRSCFDYVTLSDIYEVLSDEAKLKEMIEYAGSLLRAKEQNINNNINKNKINDNDLEDLDEIRLNVAYFNGGDFIGLDERTKAIIKSESMRVCSDFMKPLYKETFCSPKDKLNFTGFQDVINNGRIVILRMPESKYGLTGKTIGIMLKLDYFRTVLNRVYNSVVDNNVNVKRPVVFICDEYQNYVTSGDIESDTEFFARCRQSKAINIVLTQGYSSLKLKLGSEERLNSLIGNIRSSLWLSLSDDYSREKASKICDKEYKLKITENITEQDDGARFNHYIGGLLSDDNTISQGTTKTYEKTQSFDTDDFANLKLNQAVYRIYSGAEIKGPGIVYLHPIYKPKLKSYFD